MSFSADRGPMRNTLVLLAALFWGACGETASRPPETCNFLDDDGNGVVDDPFVDPAGHYLRVDHCGHCGLDCATVFPGAAVACRVVAGAPTCVLDACPAGQRAVEGAVIGHEPVFVRLNADEDEVAVGELAVVVARGQTARGGAFTDDAFEIRFDPTDG